MNIEQVFTIVSEAHKSGKRPNLRGADMSGAYMRGADLTGADLRYAYMRGADLTGADLRYAYLSGADMSGADMSGAYMRGADLTDADLTCANMSYANLTDADLTDADLRYAYLSGADLTDADLTDADLRYANLTGAVGPFCLGYFGKHHAVAAGGYISIGCERHTYQNWLDNGERIGKDNGYTDKEISVYMAWIKLAIETLKDKETE